MLSSWIYQVVSAIPIDLSEKLEGLYCGESHCALQSNVQIWNLLKDFLSRLQGNLRDFQNPQITQAAIKQPSISLTVDDLYLRDEEVTLGAEIVNVDADILRSKRNFGGLRAIITSVSDNVGELKRNNFLFEQEGDSYYKLTLKPNTH